MSNKKYSLLPEHEVKFSEYRDKWIKNAFSTLHMDDIERDKCIHAVHGMYKAAAELQSTQNIQLPKSIVFVSSPFILRFASGLAQACIEQGREKSITLLEKIRPKNDMERVVLKAISGVLNNVPVLNLQDEKMSRTNKDYTKNYVVDNCLCSLDTALQLKGAGIKKAQSCYGDAWQGGNQWSGWCAFNNFFREVVQLPIDYTNYNHWEVLCIHSGPRTVYSDFCMISDRPCRLTVNAGNQAHNEDTSFCEWRDGSELFAVQGIEVPAHVIKERDKITVEMIDREQNIEVRRVMIDFFGASNYLLAGKYQVEHSDIDPSGKPRRLLRRKVEGLADIVQVEVVNSSPEPDGTFLTFYIPIEPDLRPMLPNVPNNQVDEKLALMATMTKEEQIRAGLLGKAQERTCHNAVASTFGKYGEDYGVQGQIRQGDVLITFKDGSNPLKFRES